MTDTIVGSVADFEPTQGASIWIFGYGSLVWRPAFQFVQTKYGYIKSYKRRFWQGSTDHRGIPGAPGRVVTLISASEADYSHPLDQTDCTSGSDYSQSHVWGVCYEVSAEKVKETLEYLDYREKGGYTKSVIDVYNKPEDADPILRNVLLYTATTENDNYLGPAPLSEIANQIYRSIGPSGPNIEYLGQLHHTLVKHGIYDPHVTELYNLVTALEEKPIEQPTIVV